MAKYRILVFESWCVKSTALGQHKYVQHDWFLRNAKFEPGWFDRNVMSALKIPEKAHEHAENSYSPFNGYYQIINEIEFFGVRTWEMSDDVFGYHYFCSVMPHTKIPIG